MFVKLFNISRDLHNLLYFKQEYSVKAVISIIYVLRICRQASAMISTISQKNVSSKCHSLWSMLRMISFAALDPALPNFLFAGTGSRVSRGDANYVQVIHTNGGFLGYKSSIGDADFFPNGGRKQTGCTIDIGGSCSHARSVHYFAESINSNEGFLAKRCNSYNDFKNGKCNSNADIHMGGVAPRLNVKGDYYLQTNKKSPFAMGRA